MVDKARMYPATPQETEDIETLNAMMGGSLDLHHALNLLRKHNNNLEKAASALLEGDTGADDPYADLPSLEPLDAPGPGPRTPPREPEKPSPVIDLTADDDDAELARAMAASLEDQNATTFGPSTRAPDPNWAMVPSNVEADAPSGMSSDDQAMSRAIEASLSYSITEDPYHELPIPERVRQGDTPVALRPTIPTIAYAALLVQGLFFVPQFRHNIARWLPMPVPGQDDAELPTSGNGLAVWTMVEILANMDLARISELNVDNALNAFRVEPWASPAERPGDFTSRFYERLAYAVENVLQYNNFDNPDRRPNRLLSLQYGEHDVEPGDGNTDNLCYVRVSVRSSKDGAGNDLVSSLAAELAPPVNPKMKAHARRHVIVAPSEIIAFQLFRDSAPPTYDAAVGRRTERETFKYPKSVYLDQFMRESYQRASEKRAAQRDLFAEATNLEERKKNLLYFNDKDTLADLQSCLYYYENVAESDGDQTRENDIRANKEKLTRIIERVKEEAKAIDDAIQRTRTEAQGMLDCPELQKHRYDLRVVLVHDGLYGRSHLYSYVKQKGKWWKTIDYAVTEVLIHQVTEETVFTDRAGLHLGAGPYFLIYSRAVSQEEEDARADWPDNVKNNVKYNNAVFFEQLPPEVAARVVDPNSPPSSPYVPPTPSEHTYASDSVEPSQSRDEMMDISD
ncbi:hypothetical protein C8Q80DRAFT_1304918 [Daedaleopsis nitida]|nr:hypothetical protein C8Q80DRAFT_1304918 [Daedaleopsis nitida]